MKTIISIILAVGFLTLTSCTYPPTLWVPCDTRQVPFPKFERDHAECLERARIAWPCTDSEIRSPMRGVSRTALLNYGHQRVFVIDCLTKKGYHVLGPDEIEPF